MAGTETQDKNHLSLVIFLADHLGFLVFFAINVFGFVSSCIFENSSLYVEK